MDIDLNYLAIGEGKSLVFQHGLGADINQSLGLMSGLKNTQLVSMDCRGHGLSPLPADYTPSFDAYTDDLVRVLDLLKIEQAVFGGISMGSGISLNMAVRYPDRVKGLILVRPAWLDQGKPANLAIIRDVLKFINMPDGKKKFEQTETFKAIQMALPAAAESVLGQFSANQGSARPRILKRMFKDAPVGDLKDLEKIVQPALILGNDHDPVHPFDYATIIGSHLPNSEVHKVTSRYLDDEAHRQEVRALVIPWLERV